MYSDDMSVGRVSGRGRCRTVVVLVNGQACGDQDGSADRRDRQDILPVTEAQQRHVSVFGSFKGLLECGLTLLGDQT